MKLTKEAHDSAPGVAQAGRYDHHSYSAPTSREPRAPLQLQLQQHSCAADDLWASLRDNDKPRLPSPRTNRHTTQQKKKGKTQQKETGLLPQEKKQRLHENRNTEAGDYGYGVCYSVILPLVRFEVSCICELRPLTQSIYCGKSTINRLSQASKDNKSNNFLPHPVYHTGTVVETSSSRNLIHKILFSAPTYLFPTRTLLYWNEPVLYWNHYCTGMSMCTGTLSRTGIHMHHTGMVILLEHS
jgi:hypothetical protein